MGEQVQVLSLLAAVMENGNLWPDSLSKTSPIKNSSKIEQRMKRKGKHYFIKQVLNSNFPFRISNNLRELCILRKYAKIANGRDPLDLFWISQMLVKGWKSRLSGNICLFLTSKCSSFYILYVALWCTVAMSLKNRCFKKLATVVSQKWYKSRLIVSLFAQV